MIIIVRVGLGLAYQGASEPNTPSRQRNYHRDDPTLSAPHQASSGRGNNAQLATFQAAAAAAVSPQEDDVLQQIRDMPVGSSSKTKLDITSHSIGTWLDSGVVGNDLCSTDRNSGERNV